MGKEHRKPAVIFVYLTEVVRDFNYGAAVAIHPYPPRMFFDIYFPIPISGLNHKESIMMSLQDLRLIFEIRATKEKKSIKISDESFVFLFNTIVRLTIEFFFELKEKILKKRVLEMKYCKQATLGDGIRIGPTNAQVYTFCIDPMDIPESLRCELLSA